SELNQLYHPTGDISQDSQELVYSCENLNTTKFVPILLKEWFFLVKEGGYVVIDYQPNERCDFQKLEETMWWLWKGKYEIVYHGSIDQKVLKGITEKNLQEYIHSKETYYKTNLNKETKLPTALPTGTIPATENGYLRFVCKKTQSTIIPGDSIEKWTFGIITNGKRKDWMEQIIQSIRVQKIPNYEIIVCGTYFDPKEKDIVYLPFNQRDDKGWITRKKNLIVQHAKYENLCIIHDRILFDKEWYKGMKKWGNTFEHLSCQQLYQGKRGVDWGGPYMIKTWDDKHLSSALSALCDYRDWFAFVSSPGQLNISKKSILSKYPWDERLYWNQAEDS
ncbi:MAG: hypothetical protein KGJ07_10550, partial [Patescibacteria group bacterium]|nr:hypothetical protein [Patescibacteria group bacterium]